MKDLATAWSEGMSRLRQAAKTDASINQSYEQHQAAGTVTSDIEREWSDSGDAFGKAEWALFDTPAPSLAALEWKLIMLSHRGFPFEGDVANTVLADFQRLNFPEAQS